MHRLSPRPSPTWRAFLTTHARELVAIDFFVVPTLTFRLLFAFVVLRHDRRELVHFNVTDHHTAAWTARQLVEAFPDDTAPTYLLRDRDGVYGEEFVRHVQSLGIREVLTAPRAPWQPLPAPGLIPVGRPQRALVGVARPPAVVRLGFREGRTCQSLDRRRPRCRQLGPPIPRNGSPHFMQRITHTLIHRVLR